MKKLLIFFLAWIVATSVAGQDLQNAKRIISDLSGPDFYGRGYVNKGDSLASEYIKREMKKLRLKKFDESYFQEYHFPINTYPVPSQVKLNERELTPGIDYFIYPNSPTCKGTFDIARFDAKTMTRRGRLTEFLRQDFSNKFTLVDSVGLHNDQLYGFTRTLQRENILDAAGMIYSASKFVVPVRTSVSKFPSVVIREELMDTAVKSISIDIKNEFFEKYDTRNVIGYLPGKVDSFVVFIAHYDHIGMQGDVMYPGANDNASGTAMVLDLARGFRRMKGKPRYNVVFMLVSGEEAGLKGSRYFVENPLFPLKKIKTVFNFDMVGAGTESISVINGSENPAVWSRLEKINNQKKLIDKLYCRGIANNSDHAPFHLKGIPAIFFHAVGGVVAYHNVADTFENLTFSEFESIYQLVWEYCQ